MDFDCTMFPTRSRQMQRRRRHGDPFLAEALFKIIHRASVMEAVSARLAEMHGEHDLRVFRHHPEKGGNPHQNTAPSRPRRVAVATPTILPVPTGLRARY
jgi:hypothetical protein